MSILIGSAFALALSLPAATSADPGSAAATARARNAAPQDQGRGDRGRHPEIREAIGLLNQAQERLSHADHDFHGHRVKAMHHINEAMEELHEAMRSDRR